MDKRKINIVSNTGIYIQLNAHMYAAPDPAVRTPQDLAQAMQSINLNMDSGDLQPAKRSTSPPNSGGWSTQSPAGV